MSETVLITVMSNHNADKTYMNETALILSAFENQLGAGLVQHTVQTNPAVEQNKNIKWSESP